MTHFLNNRVVVADDDQDILDLVVFKLTQAGFETMACADGLTARARDSDVDAGFATGANDYVIKPFSPRGLMHRVNAVLAREHR
jgi:DNA-binding response OmpR family regulator